MKLDHKKTWANCLNVIKDIVNETTFKTWYEPIVPLSLINNVLVIQVPSLYFYEYIEEHCIDLLSKAIRQTIGEQAKLEYSVVMEKTAPKAKNTTPAWNIPASQKHELHNKAVEASIQDDPIAVRNPFVIPGIKKLNVDPQLNGDYSFTNYIEGDCNRLARSAGQAVAANPGKTAFNPLFIFGNSGLGKTHLAQAIGIEIKDNHPEKVVLYVNANKFETQYTESSRTNNRNDFLNFYQMIDVLIIDDIQELAGKEKTQYTFFHIFNHLHQTGKQLIITSDKAPIELQGMDERLLSRFKWGLSAELQLPSFETRVQILKNKIYKDGLKLSADVIDYIATHVTNNVRELEGALISLLALSTLYKKEIDLDTARSVIDKLVKKVQKEISVDHIQKVVCDYFKIDEELMHTNTRKREIVQARQVAMYFSKNMTNSSLATIGAKIGKKDHATVLHACKTVVNMVETDKIFKSRLQEIESQIKM